MRRMRMMAMLLACILLAGMLMGFGAAQAEAGSENTGSGSELEAFKHAKLGLMTGSSHDATAKKYFPEAERVYFSSLADMLIAVQQGKIDCYLEDEPFLTAAIWENVNVMRVETPVSYVHNGFIFPQTEESKPLREQMNAFIKKAGEDGTLDALRNKWISDTEPTEHPDYSTLTGENGVIRLAIAIDSKPMIYKYWDQCTGFEIELLTLFAREYGYAFQFEEVPFESIIAGISAGKYDMAAASLNITPEREESVDFSEPYGRFDTVMVVRGDQKNQAAPSVGFEQIANGVIGVLTGSVYDQVAAEDFPNAERKYFNSHADMIVSLSQGRIDAMFEDHTIYTTFRWENAPVIALDEPVYEGECGLIFAKDADNEELIAQINEFIAKSKADGTLDALREKWGADAEPTEHPDYSKLTGENGTLKVAVGASLKPMSYLKGSMYTGYEIEFLTLFAEEYGYKLQPEGMAFESIITSVSTGKCDLGAAGLTYTKERADSVIFSDPHFMVSGAAIIYDGTVESASPSFLQQVATSFEKTFIRENRWMLIVRGVGVTMLISICSALGGTLLGFGLYMLSRSESRFVRALANGIARVYSRIVAGTPVVVILMILFYVVFAPLRDMSGILVAIIGFSLTFGAFVFDHMTVSVGNVDWGQTEAAYALGYTRNGTFFRIVFPQAMRIFLPSYCGEIVSLVKATAVVGYIAVNDLTKMGDIIRSNTYEAFFPLIATALIYFMLTWILALLLNILKRSFEPKRRSREVILKGVIAK